ncbi:MAG: hypothetical protein R3A48_23495 [Polyangiales bacterium]
MRPPRTVVAATLAALLPAPALAQPPAPDEDLEALRAVVHARQVAEAMAQRRRWRLSLGLGVAANTPFEVIQPERQVRFDGGFSGVFSANVTRGFTELFDLYARLEVSLPLQGTSIPTSIRDAVAEQPCAGSRRFELPLGLGGLGTLELGLRVRALDARSRFFVGLGVRVAARWAEASGAWSVHCEALDGSRALLGAGELRESPVVTDLGASLETGYQFGASRAWEVGLRLSLGGIADGDITARTGQWYIAWSPW